MPSRVSSSSVDFESSIPRPTSDRRRPEQEEHKDHRKVGYRRMVGAPGRIRSFVTSLCSLGPGDGRIQAATDRAVAGSKPSRVLHLT
jgi:hypothetical protein